MATTSLVLLLTLVVSAVQANNVNCTESEDCVNKEECWDGECVCPANNYGMHCEYSVVNAVVITLICVFPPLSWTVICCYSIHSRLYAKRTSLDNIEGVNNEADREPEEEFIDDHPPPTYAQVLTFDMTGAYETIELSDLSRGLSARGNDPAGVTRGPAVDVDLEPPPSYDEWVLKAARLREQEASAGGRHDGGSGITAIAGNVESSGAESSVSPALADGSDLHGMYDINPCYVADGDGS